MKYKSITTDSGTPVNHHDIKGLKLGIRRGRIKSGTFKCTCPNNNVHVWEVSTTPFVCAGKTVKKARVGKGSNKINTNAKFIKVV